jgi:hypothetical protein
MTHVDEFVDMVDIAGIDLAIQHLRRILGAAPPHTPPVERPIRLALPGCNVWGQDAGELPSATGMSITRDYHWLRNPDL